MLPFLMAMNGGKNSFGGPDMQTMLKLMSMMNGNASSPADVLSSFFGGGNNSASRSDAKEPPRHAQPNMHDISGMLSPEMIRLLMNLAVRK